MQTLILALTRWDHLGDALIYVGMFAGLCILMCTIGRAIAAVLARRAPLYPPLRYRRMHELPPTVRATTADGPFWCGYCGEPLRLGGWPDVHVMARPNGLGPLVVGSTDDCAPARDDGWAIIHDCCLIVEVVS